MTRNDPSAAPGGIPAATPACPARADHSRFVQRIRRRYPAELPLLPAGVPDLAALHSAWQQLEPHTRGTGAALRILRQLVLERLALLDCEQHAPLESITGSMTLLAEFALDIAVQDVQQTLDASHGMPTTADGQRCPLWIVGMGKLGARELNVSSDIDLIYIYGEDGETAGNAEGRGRIANQEYFAKAVRAIYSLIGDTTEHGFVFRVDLALRPNGNSGPPAVSLDALEEYLQVQGREWERFAWLKSRVVAPLAHRQDGSSLSLRRIVIPFVFRRYLDYSVFESLRVLHRQIREHAARRSAGRPARYHDVKLSRGGIREIEFIVQLLQVVRGGQFPELRTRPTLGALPRLVRAGLMPQAAAEALARAYVFLRQVEHRIQYLDDQQTHVLPEQDADLLWIAQTLGFADTAQFLAELDAHRETVAHEFDTLLGAAPEQDCKGCNGKARAGQGSDARASGSTEPLDFDTLLEQLPAPLRESLGHWCEQPRVLALREESRLRLWRILQRTGAWVSAGQASAQAALHFIEWLEPLLRRESYLALLLERPAVHERLLRLIGAARWPQRYLRLHPGVIDELANSQMLDERFNAQEFSAELALRHQALVDSGEDGDEEQLLNLLRRAHHAEVFRTLARDIEGRLSVDQVADDLSALAIALLQMTTDWCWQRLRKKHRADPRFAIIAYGKLGGLELGYGSDLDIVFVFDDADDEASEVYAALVRKLINWLTVKTAEGDLYEIDTALRPNGNSGLLVTSFEAYANYQQQRGSNTAWTWEHQAMTRARCVLGSADLRARFDAVRQAVISAPRDADALRAEIMAMREKVRAAHPVPAGRFDVKHSPGGMVDVEFAVQYLVLAHSAQHPALLANSGNIALLHSAQACALLPPPLGEEAAFAYRALRRAQHQARLDEVPPQLAADALPTERAAIMDLVHQVFGESRT